MRAGQHCPARLDSFRTGAWYRCTRNGKGDRMRRTLIFVAALFALTACIPPAIIPASTSGSRADGIVEMSYTYSESAPRPVDWASATVEAQRRCNAWGYARTEAFAGEKRTCEVYGEGAFATVCLRGTATRNFQCLR